MKVICFKQCMVGGQVYNPGDPLNVATERDAPKYFRLEGETAAEAMHGRPLPERGADTVLILGDAECLLDDVARLPLPESFEVMAMNRAPFRWRAPVHYWVSVHGDHLVEWERAWSRLGMGRGSRPLFITPPGGSGLANWSGIANPEPGGSITVALNAAKELGFPAVFIAGAPLDGNYQHFARAAQRLVAGMRRAGVRVVAASGALAGKEG